MKAIGGLHWLRISLLVGSCLSIVFAVALAKLPVAALVYLVERGSGGGVSIIDAQGTFWGGRGNLVTKVSRPEEKRRVEVEILPEPIAWSWQLGETGLELLVWQSKTGATTSVAIVIGLSPHGVSIGKLEGSVVGRVVVDSGAVRPPALALDDRLEIHSGHIDCVWSGNCTGTFSGRFRILASGIPTAPAVDIFTRIYGHRLELEATQAGSSLRGEGVWRHSRLCRFSGVLDGPREFGDLNFPQHFMPSIPSGEGRKTIIYTSRADGCD